jgi:ribosomal protein S18 acetylase RimI-like enzyme
VTGVTEPAGDVRAVVRLGTEADAPAAARLHAAGIGEGFLSTLGPRFLGLLYRRVTRSPDAFLLVAEDEGAPVGFLAGALDLGAFYRRFVLLDGLSAVVVSRPRLTRSWRHVGETLRQGTRGGGGFRAAELLSVAVDDSRRGRGIGARLVDRFQEEVGDRGGLGARVVVAADNGAAIALYRARGFEPDRTTEVHRGRSSLVMRWQAAGRVGPSHP